MPRAKRYHTDEERRKANREKSRRYYERNRTLVLSKRASRKKDPETRLAPGRPRKYFTKEEQDEAKRNHARRYYERRVKKTTFSLRRAIMPHDLKEPALPQSLPEWVTPALSNPFSQLRALQTTFRRMTSGSTFELLKAIALQYLKSRDTNVFDKELAKYNELLKKASLIEDCVLTIEGVKAHQSAREMTNDIRRFTFWVEDLMSQALIHGYGYFRQLFHQEKLGFQVAWRRIDSTARLQEGDAITTAAAKTMALRYPYGQFLR
ncbi:hypothetical protein CC1G_12864 [Coprinopsis cinerea okayama7|uniref:Uncharacterized protein n=1 Tax=Coprinopsis cinerea (strain Okayama-7 / 130 / ATCC MYA-4618 / FGSC 9003) TaxID=240176 RepID=A8PAT8_COPC7|nr:hypothetical protein CC1G_12864 [Coprinopsis cinerea okayama7\|eukprot:XP_001840050.2 hypothetical protein CC1G_12864 [Coprinopsis cinerea okayama7\